MEGIRIFLPGIMRSPWGILRRVKGHSDLYFKMIVPIALQRMDCSGAGVDAGRGVSQRAFVVLWAKLDGGSDQG